MDEADAKKLRAAKLIKMTRGAKKSLDELEKEVHDNIDYLSAQTSMTKQVF